MRKLIILFAVATALLPGTVAAQSGDHIGTQIQIDSDATVPAGETLGTLIVISGNATIDGDVRDAVLVVDGDATVSGTIRGTLTVIEGDIHLLSGSRVKNIRSVRGDIYRDSGATVTGKINTRDFGGAWAVVGVFSVLVWVGSTVALLVAGIMFALVGARQLTAASRLMTGEAVPAIVGTVVVWIGLPILAVLAIVTIVGLPLGLGLLIFLLPALGLLGYIVAATRLGTFLVRALKQQETERPVLAVILGVLLFQFILLIPAFGIFVIFVASIWGAGALAAIAFRSVKGESTPPDAPAAAPAEAGGDTG
jgi:hypothetical protein